MNKQIITVLANETTTTTEENQIGKHNKDMRMKTTQTIKSGTNTEIRQLAPVDHGNTDT